MSKIALIVYKPRQDHTQDLIDSLLQNIPVMRKLGLVTYREQIVAKAKDGSIVQIFEWVEDDSQEQAMAHPVVQEMWINVSKISDFQKPMAVAEFQETLSMFEVVF
jgi:hypothetical protein